MRLYGELCLLGAAVAVVVAASPGGCHSHGGISGQTSRRQLPTHVDLSDGSRELQKSPCTHGTKTKKMQHRQRLGEAAPTTTTTTTTKATKKKTTIHPRGFPTRAEVVLGGDRNEATARFIVPVRNLLVLLRGSKNERRKNGVAGDSEASPAIGGVRGLAGLRGGARAVRGGSREGPDYLAAVAGSAGKASDGVVLGGRNKGDLGVRTASTLILVGSFIAVIVQLKQTGCAILVAFLQWALFKEGMAIVRDDVCEVLLEAEEGGGRALRRRQWGVFWVLGFAVYGRLLVKEIAGEAAPSAWMLSFCRWHSPISAALYVGLLLEFITSLRSPPLIMYQLGQLAAAHFACFLVLPSALVSFTARAGLVWFVVPSASVIINDIMAYICGRLFGRTPLTVLSPKKTREGFVGAAVCTSLVGLLMGRWLRGVEWLTCPRNVMLQGQDNTMDVGTMFLETVSLPWTGLKVSHAEIHAFWIALMASLIGPFGGFMASGIKRAYGVKDFGNSIPGHGGVGDRFDCQVMLLPLVYFYLKAFAPGLDI